MSSIKSFVAFCFTSALLLVGSADAATVVVNTNADDGMGACTVNNCTLRDAISSAQSGDTINFALPANSTITLVIDELRINKDLTINGPGANLLTVQRSHSPGADGAARVALVRRVDRSLLANTRTKVFRKISRPECKLI